MFKEDDKVVFKKEYSFEIMGTPCVVPKGTTATVMEDNHICVYVEMENYSILTMNLYGSICEVSLMKDDGVNPYDFLEKR